MAGTLKKAKYIIPDFFIRLKYKALNKISPHASKRCFERNCSVLENESAFFYSYKVKPKLEHDINDSHIKTDMSDIAIVLQGPIYEKNRFTIETLKLYRKWYPNIILILSTWKGVKANIREELTALNVIILENDPPKNSGMGNMNFQTVSTIGGIKKARDLSASRVLKSRTDQRFYKTYFIEFLESLLKCFPLTNGLTSQTERIIVFSASVGGTMYIPYFVSDFFFYGNAEDIENYFSILQDERYNFSSKEERQRYVKSMMKENPDVKLYDFFKTTAPEVVYFENYIQRNRSKKPDGTLYDYWTAIKESFICLSPVDLEMLWAKPRHLDESTLFHTYEKSIGPKLNLSDMFDFQRWLSLYAGEISYEKELMRMEELRFSDVFDWI